MHSAEELVSDSSKLLVFGKSDGEFGLLDEKRQSLLPVDELRQNMDSFLASLKNILPSDDKTADGMKLTVVTVAVGIDAAGKIGILGTGAEAGGDATLTLTFERR
jgi:hypothetical protein